MEITVETNNRGLNLEIKCCVVLQWLSSLNLFFQNKEYVKFLSSRVSLNLKVKQESL